MSLAQVELQPGLSGDLHFGCAQVRYCGYCHAGNGEDCDDAAVLFLSPLIQFSGELQVGRLIFVIPAFSVFAGDSAPLYKYGFTLENQVELLLE